MAVIQTMLSFALSAFLVAHVSACRQEQAKATELKEKFSQDLQTGGRSESNTASSSGEALFVEKSCDMCHTAGETGGGKIGLKGASVSELQAARSKDSHKAIAGKWPTDQELIDLQSYLAGN